MRIRNPLGSNNSKDLTFSNKNLLSFFSKISKTLIEVPKIQSSKDQGEMDLEDWELLPNNSFKDLDLDHDEDHHGLMVMDHFLCPSTQDPLRKTESPPRSIVVPKKLLQVPIAWEPVLDQDTSKIPNNPDLDPDPYPDSKQTLSTDSVSSPRVSFKIMKETEFVDMKIDPPARIITSPLPQIDDAASKPSDLEGGDDLRDKKQVSLEEEDNDGSSAGARLNLWKVGLNGIGAICSFGVAAAAATVCVFFLGHNNIKICKNKDQMLRFQIYSDDNQRMKEVVNHATKLNEAIFGMKAGVPVVRAQISFGGYYDGL